MSSVTPHENQTEQEDPPGRIARISYLKGRVSFLRAGLDEWTEAALNFPVTTGDRIYAGRDGRAEIDMRGAEMHVGSSTDVVLANLDDQTIQLGVNEGTIRVSLYQPISNIDVAIDTPNGAIALSAPGRYRANVDPVQDHTRLITERGVAKVTTNDTKQTVGDDQACTCRHKFSNVHRLRRIPASCLLPEHWSRDVDYPLLQSAPSVLFLELRVRFGVPLQQA
jgi:hypothetical protein